MVDVMRPPRITCAIGHCISAPGLSPAIIIGINANAELNAVIRIGLRRATLPSTISFCNVSPSFSRFSYSAIRSIPPRVAIPKSEMNPITDGMLTTPPVKTIDTTPPTNASGNALNINPHVFQLSNCFFRRSTIIINEIISVALNVRVARCWFSNCPLYSIQ